MRKRVFDIVMSLVLIILLSPVILLVAVLVGIKMGWPVFFVQERVGKDNQIFKIYKFRTMSNSVDKKGQPLSDEMRLTKFGQFLRQTSLDELPELFNILKGELSFVGVRPEVPKYVKEYTPEMYATLLLPAGVTSLTSIMYKDESKLLEGAKNPDEVYIKEILPEKMKYNLEYIKNFNFWYDIKLMIKTVLAVIKK
mgnify:CR=1 FL=1